MHMHPLNIHHLQYLARLCNIMQAKLDSDVYCMHIPFITSKYTPSTITLQDIINGVYLERYMHTVHVRVKLGLHSVI